MSIRPSGSGEEVKSLWSISVGLHMRYKGKHRGARRCKLQQNLKNCLSSDCRLKLVCKKSESLVIANQNVAVNDLSNFAHTAHHARRVGLARSYPDYISDFYKLLFSLEYLATLKVVTFRFINVVNTSVECDNCWLKRILLVLE